MSARRLLRTLVRRACFMAAGAALALSVGCSSTPNRSEVCLPHYEAKKIIDEAAPDGTYQAVDRLTADLLAKATPCHQNEILPVRENKARKPLNILVLSGGGQYASFAGGVLAGWSATGKRPDFDVVTGVSSGAYLAVYAYLGPKYDKNIRRIAYTLKMSDVFVYRPLYYWMRHQSIGSSEPLQKLLESEINAECLADIRAAHRSGRRLFVGTMNQRTRRLVIWDVGAIACSDRPDADQFVRKILVASSSIPGIVPSVALDVEVNGVHYQEEHVDGGAVSQGFVRFGPEIPQPDPARPDYKWLAGSNLYAIAGGKLYADTIEGRLGLLARTTSTVSGTLYALYRADLWRIYSLCAASGMKFHHMGVPDDTKINYNSTNFNGETMKELFNLGKSLGASEGIWRNTPPGCDPGEEECPRAGVRFTIP